MRAVIYSRVSTDGQERDGTSLDTQEAACREFATASGWHIVDAVRESASGASLARPELDRAREMGRSRMADVLLCYAIDRLSRDQLGVAVVLAEADDFGYTLEFVEEKFENSSIGKFILNTRAFAAELEREKILERTTRGKTERAKSGRIPQATGKGIYGYTYSSVTGRRAEHPQQAANVRRMFDECISGIGVSGIASRLNRDGVPAFAGGRWYPLTVRRMLQNPTYTGATTYRRTKATMVRDPLTNVKRRRVVERDPSEWVDCPDASPALVSRDLYDRAQEILDDPARKLRGRASHLYRLSRRLRCSTCSAPMTGQALQKGRYKYYRCRNSYNVQSDTKCPAPYVAQDILESAVFSALVSVLTDPERLLHEAARFASDVEPAKDMNGVERAIKTVEDKQRRLMQAMLNTELPEDLLKSQAKQLRNEQRRLESELAKGRTKRPTMDVASLRAMLPDLVEHVRSWVDEAKDEDLELLLRALDVRIVASRQRAVINATVPLFDLVQKLNLVTTARTSA